MTGTFKSMQVDESVAGRSLDLAAGETLSVRLKENSTTGYRWSVEQASGLRWDDHGSGAAPPGAGGEHVFEFRPERPGTHEICLRHWRDWEGERGVIARVRFTIRAR